MGDKWVVTDRETILATIDLSDKYKHILDSGMLINILIQVSVEST